MTDRHPIWLGAIVAGCLLVVANRCEAQRSGGAVNSRMICGPRCVEYVLHWYGKPEEVSDLILEIQGGQVDQPVSLATLVEALGKRQIYTTAVQVRPGTELEWKYPAIFHLKQPPGPGHYIVWVPPTADRPRLYWFGEGGFQTELTSEERQRLTGIVLLTSPEPITGPPTVAENRGLVWLWLGGPAVAVAFIWAYRRYRGRKSAAPRGDSIGGEPCAASEEGIRS